MSFLRSLSVAAVSAVLSCALLASVPLASAQLSACTTLVGDDKIEDYYMTANAGNEAGITVFGYYTSTDDAVNPYNQYIFEYVVPDQHSDISHGDYITPNDVKFAMYTYVADEDLSPTNLPLLVAESQTKTINYKPGSQTLVAKITKQVLPILPSTRYMLSQPTPQPNHSTSRPAPASVLHSPC